MQTTKLKPDPLIKLEKDWRDSVLTQSMLTDPRTLHSAAIRIDLFFRVDELIENYPLGDLASNQSVGLGFSKYAIFRNQKSEPAVRIHEWKDVQSMDIHDHTWAGYSYLSIGRIENSFYELVSGCEKKLILREHEAANSPEHEIGKISVRETKKQLVQPKDTYRLPYGDFHAAKAVTPGTVSILLRTRYLKQNSMVIR